MEWIAICSIIIVGILKIINGVWERAILIIIAIVCTYGIWMFDYDYKKCNKKR